MTDSTHSDSVVHVIDDDEAIRRSLGRLIRGAGYVFAEYATAEEFVEAWQPADNECAVVDLQLPGLDGLRLQESLASDGEGPEIIFLSGTADVPKSVAAMKAGAVDFLTKPVEKARLLDAINTALHRHASRRVDQAASQDVDVRLASLTRRQSEVLEGVVAGRLNKQIADDLGMSIQTVKIHRGRVMQKLGARSATHLVSLVIAHRSSRKPM